MKLFRGITNVLFVGALVSAALHVLLLASDSSTYRGWVLVQVSLYFIIACLLLQVRKMKMVPLFALALLTVPATYINATYLNYGNGPLLWLAPALFWVVYGALAFRAFSRVKHGRSREMYSS